IENIQGLRYDLKAKTLLLEWHALDVSKGPATQFEHLSDGQRVVISLIADIARRMCLLNPHLGLEAIRQTPAVILIDELDIHLHPQWQRKIVKGLKTAFPAAQFIAASHSPQVI